VLIALLSIPRVPAPWHEFFLDGARAPPVLKIFCHRLKVAGKLPKVVIVAVMRKMITTLNAMVRDDVPWADRLSGRPSVATAR
jgi:hypothetical protein